MMTGVESPGEELLRMNYGLVISLDEVTQSHGKLSNFIAIAAVVYSPEQFVGELEPKMRRGIKSRNEDDLLVLN